ncbi:hypothetical protein [Kribbella deserti]|uniref:Alpha/beta hydrolase n=1 Tax=Kribbella deserti TaxID=1926257 RepID=A0ABV6QRY8_9ACTN
MPELTRSWQRVLAGGAAAVLLTTAAAPGATAARLTQPDLSGVVARHRTLAVESSVYNLGDTAFEVPGFLGDDEGSERLAKIELAGVVHYPKNLGKGRHPVVLISHGLWETCADREADRAEKQASAELEHTTDPAEQARLEAIIAKAYKALGSWPCAAGTPAMPSYRGYDYLGKVLAAQGIVTVSISANGVNAGQQGQIQDEARAALINKHLSLWQRLASKGDGPLAKVLKDAPKFKGHLDMSNVGLSGHSRGGRGVGFQAADVHQAKWPAGVKIKAVLPLAAVEHYSPDDEPERPEHTPYRITNVPIGVVAGSCDGATDGRRFDFYDQKNRAPLYQWYVRGANHNFFNTQWSPASGQVRSYDDAHLWATNPPPAPGYCRDSEDPIKDDKQLTEGQQRAVFVTYASAFYRRHLLGDKSVDPLLLGQIKPFAAVEVRSDLPKTS